jgi:homoserine O-acetyltransferase
MTIRFAIALAALLASAAAQAQLLTEKKFFTLPQYTTAGGKNIKNVRVGYETYG